MVLELSDFLQQCKLSYIGLITGCEVDMISKLVCGGKVYTLLVASHKPFLGCLLIGIYMHLC